MSAPGADEDAERGYNAPREKAASSWPPQCIASTKDLAHKKDTSSNNFFRGAQWSPDGTCIIAHRNDRTIETYIMYA